MSARKKSGSKPDRKPFEWEPFLAAVSQWLLKICSIVFFIALGYILYGIFSGAAQNPNPETAARIARNWQLMGQIMTAAGFVGAVALVFLTLEEVSLAIIAGMVGAGLMFGMPMLIASNIADPSSRHAEVLTEYSRSAGMAILLVVGLRIGWAIVEQVINAGKRAAKPDEEQVQPVKEKKKTRRRSMLLWQACWDMPYCHDAVKEICPAYKAGKTCWRFGYGCNCDPSLIEQLIKTGGASRGKGTKASSEQRIREEAFVRSDLQADGKAGTRERTMECRDCAIFIEHQRQKFKVLNPVLVIMTLAALVYLFKPYTVVYERVMNQLAQIAVRLTYGDMINPQEWVAELNVPTVQILIYIIVAGFLLSYVLRFIEWAILKRMIL